MIEILSFLYLGNVFVTIGAYLPQIIKLRRIKTPAEDFSVLSWLLWSYSSTVGFLYAFLVIRDPILILVGITSLVCVVMVLCIVLYKNYKYRAVTTV
jgi:uncharacterized protein with PQ loop repeat